MNKRIKEFAEQCSHFQSPPETWFDYEKFAELIVRECMDKCYRIDTECEGKKVRSTLIAGKIAQHFKIKE